jgi:chemosensory pili system protein ChpC
MRRKTTTSTERIHTLEIPLASLSLLVPSASIAEVATLTPITPVPFAAPWLIGVVGWRTLAVPVVSFEALLTGKPVAPQAQSRIVILYPLPGRGNEDFIGVLTASEPRPRTIDAAAAVAATSADFPSSPYIASGLRVESRAMAIPNFETLKKVLYP